MVADMLARSETSQNTMSVSRLISNLFKLKTMWIARDKNGMLYVYTKKPIRQESIFSYGGDCSRLNEKEMQEVTWENSPIELVAKQTTTLNNRPYVANKKGDE